MKDQFDYYGNIITFEVHSECDGPCVNILATSKTIEDKADENDIIFHIKSHCIDIAEKHFLKTGTYLY